MGPVYLGPETLVFDWRLQMGPVQAPVDGKKPTVSMLAQNKKRIPWLDLTNSPK